MNVIKNNKAIFIILSIILVFIIIGMVMLKAFFPSGNEYGNRLKGIDKVKITDKMISNFEDKIKDRDKIKSVSINVKGRLINIIINVEEDANIDDMKDYSKERLEIFDEEELNYYDIQFYLVNENEKKENYPIIGYKHKTSEEIKWSNN